MLWIVVVVCLTSKVNLFIVILQDMVAQQDARYSPISY